jgi:hypothetical protein
MELYMTHNSSIFFSSRFKPFSEYLFVLSELNASIIFGGALEDPLKKDEFISVG